MLRGSQGGSRGGLCALGPSRLSQFTLPLCSAHTGFHIVLQACDSGLPWASAFTVPLLRCCPSNTCLVLSLPSSKTLLRVSPPKRLSLTAVAKRLGPPLCLGSNSSSDPSLNPAGTISCSSVLVCLSVSRRVWREDLFFSLFFFQNLLFFLLYV